MSVWSILLLVLGVPSCARDSEPGPEEAPEVSDDASTSSGALAGSSSLGGTSGTTMTTTTTTEPSSSSGAAASSSGGSTLTPIALQPDWLQGMEGAWLGPVRASPQGPIPQFFLDFVWEDDGSLHAAVDNGEGFGFDFRFVEDEDGQWIFVEQGTLPGGLTQTYTLHPVEQDGARVRFDYLAMPGFLAVEIDLADERFVMDVAVLGSEHAAFDLARPG